MRRRSWLYPVTVLVAVAVLIGAGTWLAWALRGQLSALDAPPVPVVAEVRDAPLDYSSAATVTGRTVAPVPVLWNGATGTVTAVHVAGSALLGSGSPIVDVDGVTVRGYVADSALFRPLSRGDKGPDVAVIQILLNELVPDVSLPASGTFGSATAAAVRKYEKMLGVTPTGTLSPQWFLLLPTPGYQVEAVSLRVGQPAPAAGAAFLTGVSTVEGMQFAAEEAGPDGRYQFSYRGSTYPLTFSGGEWSLDDEAQFAALLNAPAGSNADEPGTAEVAEVDQSDSAGSVTVKGRVALADPEPGQAVPPSALVLAAGSSCVLLAVDHSPVTVRLVGSAIDGSALIAADLPEGSSVLVNPLEMVPEATCP